MGSGPANVMRGVLVSCGVALPSSGQEPPAPAPPAYKQLRYEEDYAHLRDPTLRMDFWDPVKYVALNESGDWFFSLGGEARERYEFYHNSSWGAGPQDDDGYLLQRYLLHADLHLGDLFRVFAQLQSSLENGRTGGPRPTDEDQLEVHQAFFDLKLDLGTASSLTLRGGRQELLFGSSRLVGVRDGPNVRLSFDGGRLSLTAAEWNVDAFLTKPVETDPGVFDNGFEDDRLFWGLYAVHPLSLVPSGNIDLYYLGLDQPDAEFDQGTADEERHSLGVRIWGKPGGWDYNLEGVYQWGRFGRGDIQAWTVASETGYTFTPVRFSPRISLRADITSGDRDPNDPDLETFNPLFPRGSYFGEIGLLGPVNHIDLHPSVELQLLEKLLFWTDCVFFWRESADDGIYGNGLNLLRSGSGSRARFVGIQPSANVEWRVDRHLSFTAVYSHFFAGPFLKDTGPSEDVDFVGTWLTYRF